MLAILAAVVFAQSTVTLQVGSTKQDSLDRAKRDSIAYRREQRRDSLRARAQARDSVRQRIRIARQLPITPAVLAGVSRVPPAGVPCCGRGEAGLTQDSPLTATKPTGNERW